MADPNPKVRRGGGRAFHSVLEPHYEFIRQLRRQRLTWREIAERLAAEKGLRVSLHAAYRYCRRRKLRRRSWEDGPPPEAGTGTSPAGAPPTRDADVPGAAPAPMLTRKPYLPTRSFRAPDPKNLSREEFP